MHKNVTVIGFDQAPFAIVYWKRGEMDFCKTVCYDKYDVQEALSRQDMGGMYSELTPVIHYNADIIWDDVS